MVGTIIGIGANALMNQYNNQQAAERAEQDRLRNFQLNERAAQNADYRTRQLYADFYSPEAQMRQIKEAGLSPSIYFGGTPGQGGIAGAQGGGVSGIQTPYMPMSLLEGAQVANLIAQAEKTKAETKQIEPIANATVSSLLAEGGYKKAAASAAKAQTEGIKLDNYIKEHTKEASIYQICEMADQAGYEAERTYYEMKEAGLLYQFDTETFNTRKEIVQEQLNQLAQSIAESKSAEKLNDQQRKYLKDQILQNISMTMLEWEKYELNTDQFETFLEKQIPIMEKQLNVELEKLGIEKRKLVINAITDTFKSVAMGAMAASSMGIGKGGNLTPPAPKPTKNIKMPQKGSVPIYKQNTVWDY